MRHAVTLLAIACGVTITLAYQLGQQWITEGYGINPLIAGGYIVVMFCVCNVITALLNSADSIRAEDEN